MRKVLFWVALVYLVALQMMLMAQCARLRRLEHQIDEHIQHHPPVQPRSESR